MRIKGIDERIARALARFQVTTVKDLAALDPVNPLPGVPPSRVRKFVEKALILRHFQPLATFAQLANLSVVDALHADAEELQRLSRGELDKEQALDVQRALGVLQVALDVDVLQRVRLKDLLVGG